MIAVPFWESVLGVFRMPGLTETLHSNREYWRKLKGVRETARKAKQEALADASTSAEAAGEGGAAGATEYSKSKTTPRLQMRGAAKIAALAVGPGTRRCL